MSGGAPQFESGFGGDRLEVGDATDAVGAEEFTGEVCRRGHAEVKRVRKAKCVCLVGGATGKCERALTGVERSGGNIRQKVDEKLAWQKAARPITRKVNS